MKQKISQFEFAIMETITPEKAKDFEPRTDEEELNIRQQKLLKQVKNLFIPVVSGSNNGNACKQCGEPIAEGFRFCSGVCKEYYYR